MKLLATVVALICATSQTSGLDVNPCAHLPAPGDGFVNDVRGCASYFSCVRWLPFEISCPAPFYFDPRRNVCDLPQNVDCNLCQPTGVHAVDDPSSCTKWFLCVNGRKLPQECAPGTAFDPERGTCNLAENVRCQIDTCANIDGGVGVAADPDSCESYLYCYNGRQLARGQCSPGLAFDSTEKRCVRAESATCFPGTSRRRFSALTVPVAASFALLN